VWQGSIIVDAEKPPAKLSIFAHGTAENPSTSALLTLPPDGQQSKEWRLIWEVPEFKLFKEEGRSLRLDHEAERKLLLLATILILMTPMCTWSPRMRDQLGADGSVANQCMEYPKTRGSSYQLFPTHSTFGTTHSPVDVFTAG
jgi:hypothetical protein